MKNEPSTLPQTLGVKPGFTVCVVNEPEGYVEALGAGIRQARVMRGIEDQADIIQVFTRSKSDLESSFPHLLRVLPKRSALWVCWPKGSSVIETDLTRDTVRSIGQRHGLSDVKLCGIHDDWSGIKFVYRLKGAR